MANIKTDLSLPDALYNQVSILANEMQIPENQLFIQQWNNIASVVFTVDQSCLIDKIGRLSREKVREIIRGLVMVTEPQEID